MSSNLASQEAFKTIHETAAHIGELIHRSADLMVVLKEPVSTCVMADGIALATAAKVIAAHEGDPEHMGRLLAVLVKRERAKHKAQEAAEACGESAFEDVLDSLKKLAERN